MKKFDFKTLKENKWFFLISITVIFIVIFISFFFKESDPLQEEITDGGEVSYSKLVINEIATNNKGTIMASDGGLYDWIEIYNGKSKDVNLTNYSLSDTKNEIKWSFPNGTIIKSGEYLIVFLGGIKTEGLIGNFKLSSKGGETLALRNSNKKIIDAVETKALTNDQVMARNLSGSWEIYGIATPGNINTKEGFNSYINSIAKEESFLTINEVLPVNKGIFKNSFNEYSGYIELKNTGNDSISLKEFAISDEENKPFKYTLPDITLNKGEIFLIYTSNRNTNYDGEYHASFKLNDKNGNVLLTHLNKLVENIKYESLPNGYALAKENNEMIPITSISPGHNNDKEGINSFQKKYLKLSEGLVISEVMTKNATLLSHNGGKTYDWIELYNNSNENINLKEYCLAKSDTNCSNKLPDIVLKPKNYYVLMASGDKNLSNNSYTHIDFKIGDNDAVYLFKENKIIDSIFIPKLDVGSSIGKDLNYGIYYYTNPTPKEANKTGIMAVTLPPTINQVGGIYNDVNELIISFKGDGIIYYTTDGTTPTSNSTKYSEDIVLNKTTVLKAIAIGKDKKASEILTNSYIINENHTIPVMSVSLNPSEFSYINSHAWELEVEKTAYVEYFDGDNGFNEPCGLKLFGGSTRGPAKKSYALKFRKIYGTGTLNYQVFDNRDYSTFDSLVLRTGSQDEYAEGYTRAMIRDILGTSLVDGVTNVYVQAYKTIILYINGNYRGIYFIREKIDDDYVTNNFNLSNKDETDLLRIDGEVKSGNKNEYNKLIDYINNNDLSNNIHYEYVKSKIDIDSLIDFWVAESYVTNNDIVNCRYFRNPSLDNGKWKFIFYDLDWAWYNYDRNYYKFATDSVGMTVNGYSTILLRNLMKNDNFKTRFIERVSYQLKNVWNKERIYSYMEKELSQLEPELKRNYERWGYSMDDHNEAVELLKEYIEKRENVMKKQTKSFFSLSNEEMTKYFGE